MALERAAARALRMGPPPVWQEARKRRFTTRAFDESAPVEDAADRTEYLVPSPARHEPEQSPFDEWILDRAVLGTEGRTIRCRCDPLSIAHTL